MSNELFTTLVGQIPGAEEIDENTYRIVSNEEVIIFDVMLTDDDQDVLVNFGLYDMQDLAADLRSRVTRLLMEVAETGIRHYGAFTGVDAEGVAGLMCRYPVRMLSTITLQDKLTGWANLAKATRSMIGEVVSTDTASSETGQSIHDYLIRI